MHGAGRRAGPRRTTRRRWWTAIKNYVEDGGRATFMLDNVLRIGHSEPAADNDESSRGTGWLGRHRQQRPGARSQRPGTALRLRPGVPVMLHYESHPITQPLARVPTAFPLTRSLDIKSGDKTSVEQAGGNRRRQRGHHRDRTGRRRRSQEGQEGPADPDGRGHLLRPPSRAGSW